MMSALSIFLLYGWYQNLFIKSKNWFHNWSETTTLTLKTLHFHFIKCRMFLNLHRLYSSRINKFAHYELLWKCITEENYSTGRAKRGTSLPWLFDISFVCCCVFFKMMTKFGNAQCDTITLYCMSWSRKCIFTLHINKHVSLQSWNRRLDWIWKTNQSQWKIGWTFCFANQPLKQYFG